MLGITGLLRYYFYLSEECDRYQPLLDRLDSDGFQCLEPKAIAKELDGYIQGNYYYELEQEKTRILVVYMMHEELLISDSLARLAEINDSILDKDELLGQTTVLLSTMLDWSDLINSVKNYLSNRKAEYIPLQAGQMARFIPSSHDVYYVCQPEQYDRSVISLMTYSLPLIEAGYIETRMISNLLRDRGNIIEQEQAELDRNLSRILHSNLVTAQSGLKQVEDLEEQIEQLSLAYGMIAGNITIAAEGRRRLEASLQRFMTQLRTAPALKPLAQETAEIISRPFMNRLKSLLNLNEMLYNSRDSYQAAIDVVRSRIDIMNSRANISTQEKIRELMELNTSMQKQSLTFQFAAGLIEFIVLAYYSHSLWKNLAYNAYNNVPSMLQLIIVIIFSGLTTYLTHIVAEYLQGDTHLKKKLFLAGIPLLLLLLFVFAGTIMMGGGGAH